MAEEITITKVKNYGGSWQVGLQLGGKLWARFYHYKADAICFKQELTAARRLDGVIFHPTQLHMYEQPEGGVNGKEPGHAGNH